MIKAAELVASVRAIRALLADLKAERQTTGKRVLTTKTSPITAKRINCKRLPAVEAVAWIEDKAVIKLTGTKSTNPAVT